MPQASRFRLGLIIRGAPYGKRTPRSDVDLALAAAALDFRLDLFFLGESVLQLLADRAPEDSRLPAGYRAWASLPELAEARFYVEEDRFEACAGKGLTLALPVTPLSAGQMPDIWRRCQQVLVL
jgi:sulfur relay (sulfurtransferase) DsrF/TusC family protein